MILIFQRLVLLPFWMIFLLCLIRQRLLLRIPVQVWILIIWIHIRIVPEVVPLLQLPIVRLPLCWRCEKIIFTLFFKIDLGKWSIRIDTSIQFTPNTRQSIRSSDCHHHSSAITWPIGWTSTTCIWANYITHTKPYTPSFPTSRWVSSSIEHDHLFS